jgi:hypothetical protein
LLLLLLLLLTILMLLVLVVGATKMMTTVKSLPASPSAAGSSRVQGGSCISFQASHQRIYQLNERVQRQAWPYSKQGAAHPHPCAISSSSTAAAASATGAVRRVVPSLVLVVVVNSGQPDEGIKGAQAKGPGRAWVQQGAPGGSDGELYQGCRRH